MIQMDIENDRENLIQAVTTKNSAKESMQKSKELRKKADYL